METLFQQILNLLIQPPGNLIYHLVLAFSVISSLQAAWIGRSASGYRHTGRLIFGLGMLLLGQVVLFLSSGLAWQGILDSHLFLPVLDRAVILFSLVWIVWLWNFAAPAKLGDVVTGFLNLGVIILFVFTYTSWKAQGGNLPFNNSWMDWAWVYAGLFVVIIGTIMLALTRPTGWGFGLGMLVLFLAGLAAHLTLPSAGGDFSGYIRLSQLAAFPLLTTLLNRFSEPAHVRVHQRASESSDQGPFPRTRERRRYSTDPRTLHALLDLCNSTDPEKIITGLPKAIAHTMLADLCFIVNGPNYGHIVLQSGYDLIREEEIKGTMLEQGQLPMLSNALQRGKVLMVIPNDSEPQDLKAISTALGLKETGSLMFLPLTMDEKSQGGILFLSPYSNREWNQDDQGYLASEMDLIAQLVNRALIQEDSSLANAKIADNLRAEIENLRQENLRMLSEVNELRQAAPSINPQGEPEMDLSALVALQQEAQDQIATLQAENERLQSALKGLGITVLSPEEFDRMEFELQTTLKEVAQLQNQLAEANARNLTLERETQQSTTYSAGENHEVVTSIVQEIRQPMSSIVGYTDLLLNESVGILGALQKQFLERIKASAERMRGMLQDLIRVAALQQETIALLPQPIELGTVIDHAVDECSSQLREKNIALQVDLPQEMPKIYADRDAVQQIILQLLLNAGGATPEEGTVTLRARIQPDSGRDYLLIQVTDTGGGLQSEDLPRVFSRRYRADQPLIQGLGDTGIALSIAKTLTEAHGGRIWVDTTAGQSSTFSVLLPVNPNLDHRSLV